MTAAVTAPTLARSSVLAPLAVGATIILWASAFPAIRAGLESFSPLALAALRFAAASAVLAVIAPLAGIGLPAGADWPRVLLAGAVGIAGYNILLNYGQTTVAAGPAAFLINTHPIIAALLGTAFLGERLRPWGWIGIAISFAGVGVIAMERSGGALALERGTIFVLAAAFCFALHFVIQKPLLTRYSALQVATWMIWSGTALLTPFLPQALESVSAASPRSLGATVFLAVGPAVLAYFAWAYALARFPVSRAAAFLYLVVPTTLVIAYLWLGEVPTAGTLGGGALALSGVIVVNTLGRAPRR